MSQSLNDEKSTIRKTWVCFSAVGLVALKILFVCLYSKSPQVLKNLKNIENAAHLGG